MKKMILENIKQNELIYWLLPMLMDGKVMVGKVESELGMVVEDNFKYGKA